MLFIQKFKFCHSREGGDPQAYDITGSPPLRLLQKWIFRESVCICHSERSEESPVLSGGSFGRFASQDDMHINDFGFCNARLREDDIKTQMGLLTDSLSLTKNIMKESSPKQALTVVIKNKASLGPQNNPTLQAGAAKVDITPPIGMPMAGYSTMSTDSVGVRAKLMARVFYIKPKSGSSVALVQCDLLAGSLILHHKIAELIADETDVGVGGLLLAGTHTHSGPGNFFGSMFYNRSAANQSGFDPTLFDFLSQRISSAIIEAYAARQVAKIATGTTEITGVARNRSLPAYHRNKNIASSDKRPTMHEAVNPYFHMIRVDGQEPDGSFKPLGAFSNFSLHPNTNPAELGAVYSGDVFGFAEREVEWLIKQHYQTAWEPIHALANFTHGDNNPDYDQTVVENFEDLKKYGIHIADEAFKLFKFLDTKLEEEIPVKFRAREIDVFKDNGLNGIKIADRPVVGMSVLAGAQGRGRTSFVAKLPYFAPGWPKRIFAGGEQGPKRRVAGPLQSKILPREEFPHLLFLQVMQVGDTVLLPLPFEVTYETGMRIAAQTAEKSQQVGLDGVHRFIAMGVSNGYWGYVTTPEEYSLQYYEGGSTFYGPNTGAFLTAHIGQLVEELASEGNGADLPDSWEFKMRPREFVVKDGLKRGIQKSVQEPEFCDKVGRNEAYWSFQWLDAPAPLFEMHKDLVRIEVQSDDKSWEPLAVDNRPISDAGFDMSVICLQKETDDGVGLYEARWYIENPDTSGSYRFTILTGDQSDFLYSSPFTL